MQHRRGNPWRTLGFALAVAIPALVAAGAVIGMLEDDRRVEELASVAIAESAPPASVAEACNRRAAEASAGATEAPRAHDASAMPEVAADAAPDASAARAHGGLVGMSEQTSRSPAARAAFRDCLRSKGYAS